MTFRQVGGLAFAAKNNIVSSHYLAANELFVPQQVGKPLTTVYVDAAYMFRNTVAVARSLHVAGPTTLQQTLEVAGNTVIGGTTTLQQTLEVAGNTVIGGTTALQQSLEVGGSAVIGGTTTLQQSLEVAGSAVIGGTATLQQSLEVAGNTVIGGTTTLQETLVVGSNAVIGGTTTLQQSLEVGGSISVEESLDVAGPTTLQQTLQVADNASFAGDVTVAGNLYVSGAMGFSGDLALSGNFSATTVTASAFNTTSDYRIKTNVVPLVSPPLDSDDTLGQSQHENRSQGVSLDAVRPVLYDNAHTRRREMGVLAHELQAQFPTLVTGVKDGPALQTVNYAGLIPLLVAELQQTKRAVRALQAAVADLTSAAAGAPPQGAPLHSLAGSDSFPFSH